MSFTRALLLTVAAASSLFAQAARAEPTEIVVRVMAKDGKFVGTAMGGRRSFCAMLTAAKFWHRG